MREAEPIILIVDDEPDMCWALQHILRGKGLDSKIAMSGQETLALVAKYNIRLAFLDAKLPDMEGLELARRIREIDPSTRIAMVSGYFYESDFAIQKAYEEGLIVGFISKPFLNDEILRVIEMNDRS